MNPFQNGSHNIKGSIPNISKFENVINCYYSMLKCCGDSQLSVEQLHRRVETLVCKLASSHSDAVLNHTAFRPSFKDATIAYPLLLPTSTTVTPSQLRFFTSQV